MVYGEFLGMDPVSFLLQVPIQSLPLWGGLGHLSLLVVAQPSLAFDDLDSAQEPWPGVLEHSSAVVSLWYSL